MSQAAIRVQGLGKRYQIGALQQRHRFLGDHLIASVTSPLRRAVSRVRPSNDNGAHARAAETFWALRDVSFEVTHGEVLGIIGRNGAGKSTLLKILSRITKPTTGRVELFGRVGSLLEVGTGFHNELTGRENIFLNGAILGMRRAEIARKFDEIVAFAEVEEFIDTPVKHYSSGMYMRLAFAVAAHLEPEILIVDEVLAVGDAAFQEKCLGKMDQVTKQGRTVLFVSHNMAAVHSLCRNCILLDKGRIARYGSTAEVVPHYLQKHAEQHSTYAWTEPTTAPGNDKAHLSAIRLLDSSGMPNLKFRLSEPVTIQIDYTVHVPNTRWNISLSLYSAEGVYVLASPSHTDSTWYQQPHPVGRFRSECVLPPHLLNEGRYDLTLLLVENGREVVAQVERIVSLEMVDLGESRGGFYDFWGGVVRPRLNWQTSQINS